MILGAWRSQAGTSPESAKLASLGQRGFLRGPRLLSLRSTRRAPRGGFALLIAAASLSGCTLTAPVVMPAAPEVRDLPLIEVLPDTLRPGTPMAVLLTGDGGWAGHSRRLSAALARRGVPVVGWNSLRYYWVRRSPEEAAADLARVIGHYRRRWRAGPVLVLGYSYGADVAPFLVRRLPDGVREEVAGVGVMGFSPHASFRFYIPLWWGRYTGPTLPTRPELLALAKSGVRTVCVNGTREAAPARGCEGLEAPGLRVVLLPAGHHFRQHADALAELLLAEFVLEP